MLMFAYEQMVAGFLAGILLQDQTFKIMKELLYMTVFSTVATSGSMAKVSRSVRPRTTR